MAEPLVFVIIVTFNGMRWLSECLETLARTSYPNFRTIVVDNGSSDGSRQFVRASYPEVSVIANKTNLGFCEGNNVGIAAALEQGAEYVVLLNNDTKVTENWLDEIVEVGELAPRVGVLGAVQLSYGGEDFNSWTKTVARDHLAELSDEKSARRWIPMRWVEGSCFAIKRAVIEEVGDLDPIYFMYYEEIDYCRRVAAHGYEIALVTRSRIHHFRGGTSHLDAKSRRNRELQYDRSHFVYHASDLRFPLVVNAARTAAVLCQKCLEQLARGRLRRALDQVSIQGALWRSRKELAKKWKADRARLAFPKASRGEVVK